MLHFRHGMILAALAGCLTTHAVAQTYAGYDDFKGGDAKWAYSFRPPYLTTGTNGVLSFSGSRLDFTKSAGLGSQIIGWDGDGIAGNTTSRLPSSFTTSWVAEISVTNLATPEAGAFSSVGFEVAVGPTAYTEITLQKLGGQLTVRTETNSATTGVASAAATATTDVRLRIAWDAAARVLTTSYSFDAGASFATLRTIPIAEWPTLPTAGFYFELMGYSSSAAAIGAGQLAINHFSVTPVPADYPRLTNLSVRNVTAEGDRTLIVGFSVAGEGTRPLIIRAVSETIGRVFGVPGVLADVDLALYAGNTTIGTATNVSAGMSTAFGRVGAFLLDPTTTDAATLRAVTAGTYSAHAVPAPGATRREGATLLEIYEDGRLGTRLTNLSARTQMSNEPLLVGFAVGGTQRARVLVRAAGPALAAFGVGNAVADPRIALVRMSDNRTIGQNNDWSTAAAEVTAAANATGAFAFAPGSKDAALVLDVEPGTYSAVLESADNTSGVVLAEVYLITP